MHGWHHMEHGNERNMRIDDWFHIKINLTFTSCHEIYIQTKYSVKTNHQRMLNCKEDEIASRHSGSQRLFLTIQ
ncbi:unnamed protein product [Brassica rapa subsp. trilocularis]